MWLRGSESQVEDIGVVDSSHSYSSPVFNCFHRDWNGSQLSDLLLNNLGQVPLFSSVK